MVASTFQIGPKSRATCLESAAATRVSCEWLIVTPSGTRASCCVRAIGTLLSMLSTGSLRAQLHAPAARIEEAAGRHQLREHFDERQIPDVAVIVNHDRIDIHDPERGGVERIEDRRIDLPRRPLIDLEAHRTF